MKKAILLFALIVTVFAMASCAPKKPTDEPSDDSSSTEEAAPVSSEQAMENFLRKVWKANYVLRSKDYVTTTVYSDNLVCFDYDDESFHDFAVMTVNNETFQAGLTDDGVSNVEFFSEGKATEAAEKRLLHHWLLEEVTQGNIYNLFYNDVDDPLRFVSYDNVVKRSLMTFGGYPDHVGAGKPIAYYNEDEELIVAIDYSGSSDGARSSRLTL